MSLENVVWGEQKCPCEVKKPNTHNAHFKGADICCHAEGYQTKPREPLMFPIDYALKVESVIFLIPYTFSQIQQIAPHCHYIYI